MNQTMTLRHWPVLLLTAALFGSSFLFINIAVKEIPPLSLAAGRALLAVPIGLLMLRAIGLRLPRLGRAWLPLIVLGIFTAAIPYAAIAWGQRHIESGLAGILFGTIPVFSVVLTPLLARDERFSSGRILGALIGFAGVVLVIGPKALGGLDGQLLGAGVTLGAALAYALGAIYARTKPDIHPAQMTAGQLVVASIVLSAGALAFDTPWQLEPSLAALGAVAWTAVLSTALPVILLFWLIRNVGATNASIATFFMPVVAVALGALLLGEQLPWQAFAGLGLILLGALAVNGVIPGLRSSQAADGRAG